MKATSLSLPWAGSRSYVRFLYAVWSKIYDLTIAWDKAYRGNAKLMIERTVRQGDRVLDIGIGTGMLAEYGAPMAAEYVGIDYSGAMLAKCAKKIARLKMTNVQISWGDAKSLPFKDGQFDAAVSSFALPHFAKDEKVVVLREIARVLKPRGRFGLFLAQGEVAPLFSMRDELEHLLSEAGFVEVRIEDRDDVYRIVTAVRGGG